MIKLIATDVDGTLVKDGTLEINPEYMEIINRLVAQGILFVVCSGRQFVSQKKLFAPIKEKLLYIADGGTVIRDYHKLLKVFHMKETVWRGMYEMVQTMPQCDCFVATPEYCLAEDAKSTMFRWLKDSYGYDIREVADLRKYPANEIIKFSVYHKNACEEMCRPLFIPTFEQQAKVTVSGKEWVDCLPKNVNKGSSLDWLLSYLNIKPEEVCVFGDNLNDIEMLTLAGESYAVSNAREEVRLAAKHVCDPYWEDGVLKVLKSFLA